MFNFLLFILELIGSIGEAISGGRLFSKRKGGRRPLRPGGNNRETNEL